MSSIRPVRPARLRRDRGYLLGALVFAAATFLGFAPTYFLKPILPSPELPPLVHWHGAAFTAWVVLFATQTWLIDRRRTDLDRRLCMSGIVLAVAMVVLGLLTTFGAARRGIAAPGFDTAAFMIVPGLYIVLFAIFVALGIAWRTRPEYYKRLMLLATLSLMGPALARLPALAGKPPDVPMGVVLVIAIVLATIALDWRANRRLHPVLLWGGLLIITSVPLRIAAARSDGWIAIAHRIVNGS
jgi:uncharacterized membrane protein